MATKKERFESILAKEDFNDASKVIELRGRVADEAMNQAAMAGLIQSAATEDLNGDELAEIAGRVQEVFGAPTLEGDADSSMWLLSTEAKPGYLSRRAMHEIFSDFLAALEPGEIRTVSVGPATMNFPMGMIGLSEAPGSRILRPAAYEDMPEMSNAFTLGLRPGDAMLKVDLGELQRVNAAVGIMLNAAADVDYGLREALRQDDLRLMEVLQVLNTFFVRYYRDAPVLFDFPCEYNELAWYKHAADTVLGKPLEGLDLSAEEIIKRAFANNMGLSPALPPMRSEARRKYQLEILDTVYAGEGFEELRADEINWQGGSLIFAMGTKKRTGDLAFVDCVKLLVPEGRDIGQFVHASNRISGMNPGLSVLQTVHRRMMHTRNLFQVDDRSEAHYNFRFFQPLG